MEHDIYAGTVQDAFTGPMTIRVHEPSGLPYEQIVEIRDGETKVEFHYNSKNKNQLRKRRQRQKEAAADGHAHVAEDGDDFVPTYSLGDVLTSEQEMKEWNLVGFSQDQERILENASYEWIRVDKDFEWIANTTFHPGGQLGELELMYIMQLQGDNDVVAHLEAIQYLSRIPPTQLLSTIFVRTLMDSRYFYGVRVQVITTVAGVPVEFCILPGRFADIEGLAHLPLDLPIDSDLIADSAYTQFEWEEYLLKTQRIRFLVQAKSNTRRAVEPRLEDYKTIFRKRIETAFGELVKLFPKKIHATSLKGFLLKIQLFLFIVFFLKKKN